MEQVFVVFKWRCVQCGAIHEDFAKRLIFTQGQKVVCGDCGYNNKVISGG